MNKGVEWLMLVLFILFLSDLLRGLCQTLVGLAFLVSSLDFKFRAAIVPPCMLGWAAISERKPRVASILALQGHGSTQSFPNTQRLIIYMSIVKALRILASLTLT